MNAFTYFQALLTFKHAIYALVYILVYLEKN